MDISAKLFSDAQWDLKEQFDEITESKYSLATVPLITLACHKVPFLLVLSVWRPENDHLVLNLVQKVNLVAAAWPWGGVGGE
jgi:hypothetical protein